MSDTPLQVGDSVVWTRSSTGRTLSMSWKYGLILEIEGGIAVIKQARSKKKVRVPLALLERQGKHSTPEVVMRALRGLPVD